MCLERREKKKKNLTSFTVRNPCALAIVGEVSVPGNV